VPDEAALRAAYDAELSAFALRNEISAYTWTERVKNRLGRLSSLNGRDGLRGVLAGLGFPLR
jgi:hypothetical protein